MIQYVALLRGINVGGRMIKMDAVTACFKNLGLTGVVTIRQSGNVIFSSDQDQEPALKETIESGLTAQFTYLAKAQILAIDRLKQIVQAYPFDRSNLELHHYVVFLEGQGAADLVQETAGLNLDLERIAPGNGVVYWQVPKGLTLTSPFATYLTKARYKTINTNRNIQTLEKVLAAA